MNQPPPTSPDQALRRTRVPSRAVLLAGLGLAIQTIAITPFVEHRAERSQTAHYTEHGCIFIGGLLMGLALHAAISARRRPPWAGSVGAPLVAACTALLVEIGLTTSWVDSYTDAHPAAHYAAHGLMFLGGVLVSFALSSPRLRRRMSRRRRGAPTT